MSSRFDVCLLLYVNRLAGWLKHCNLSLSGWGLGVGSRKLVLDESIRGGNPGALVWDLEMVNILA